MTTTNQQFNIKAEWLEWQADRFLDEDDYFVGFEDGDHRVATVFNHHGEIETKHTAHLMAASADLLVASLEALECLDHTNPQHLHAITLLEAAIKKATQTE
ncbi:MAG TPA: hypothetical protein V6C65_23635 [Allocoleopsis sp.]